MHKRYYSKHDPLLTVIVWGSIIISFIPIISGAIRGSQALCVLSIIWTLVIGFLGWLWLGTYYELHEKYLLICSGPIKEKYYYKNITLIKSSQALCSSSSLSIIRLEVYCNGYLIRYISPKDTSTFIKDFRAKCPSALVEVN
ncbi:PH domain-containing protein [Wukongibacter baidiensis]|uniref:PH domain-containing protein n=1 Tax=Wukongibacter baidiensis TaxID=1723361 RepID=UPI003D7FDEE1